MKTVKKFMRAGALMSAFCVGLAACNESEILKPAEDGLGREIPGVETHHATGTIIGSYTNGFGSWLVQVDEEYPLGKSLDHVHNIGDCTNLDTGTYRNVIRVQWALLVSRGDRMSFSAREFKGAQDPDDELFIIGEGEGNTFCGPPSVPAYVITEYKFLESDSATRAIGKDGAKEYYWSGGRKIYLDMTIQR